VQEEARLNFQQTLLNAGMEVNNALTQAQTFNDKSVFYDNQVNALVRSVKSTGLLMDYGSSTYLEVLTAQEELLLAQLTQITNRYNEISSVIALYQALGGGYNE
jgi:outer membrane protein TolC